MGLWFPGRHRGARARVERLEPRVVLAAVYPSDVEQYVVELVNRARADPAGEAARFGIDLNEGLSPGTISAAAKQPLAINPFATDAARDHGQWMVDTDTFSHTGQGGSNPGARMAAAGYAPAGTFGWGENLAWTGTSGSVDVVAAARQLHQNLFVDAGVAGRGHRTNLLNAGFREVGAGVVAGTFGGWNAVMLSQDFGNRGGDALLTGVAFTDAVLGDDFYTPGEGLGGVTVTATRASDAVVFSTTTWSAGGYALRLAAGTYTVTATGAGLNGTVSGGSITIGATNVKLDVRPLPTGGGGGGGGPVTPPPPPVTVGTGTGLPATYFDNPDFTGPSATRTDATVDFDWGGAPPITGVAGGTFAVRWTGYVQAQELGRHRLRVEGDGAFRVLIDGRQVMNKRRDRGWTARTLRAFRLEPAQRVQVTIEFADTTGVASARLLWRRPGQTLFELVPQSQLYAA